MFLEGHFLFSNQNSHRLTSILPSVEASALKLRHNTLVGKTQDLVIDFEILPPRKATAESIQLFFDRSLVAARNSPAIFGTNFKVDLGSRRNRFEGWLFQIVANMIFTPNVWRRCTHFDCEICF